MTSLKRLLNPESSEDGSYGYQPPRTEFSQEDSFENDIPVLNNLQSWPQLWSEVLNTEFAGVDFPSQFDSLDVNDSTVFGPGDGIEFWADQNLPPLSQNLTPEPVSTNQYFFPNQAPTPPPEQVCYGMIHSAAVRVQGDMAEVDAKLTAGKGLVEEGYNAFNLNLSEERLVLEFQDGSTFGILNTHVTNALKHIVGKRPVEFDTLGHTTQIREAIEKATNAKDAMVRVQINVYGPKDIAEEIGNHLTGRKTYLQRPDVFRRGINYDNPHVFRFSGMELPDLENRAEVGKQRPSANDEKNQFRKTINNVYASLTRGKHLNQIQGDDRLGTKLLRHQQEALDFMTQRENGPVSVEYRLWKPMSGEDQGWYRHEVTKLKTRIHHSETGGGILADEMGMGKSLSILALVTKTHEESLHWSQTVPEEVDESSPKKKKRSRATLILVPSAILINEWLNEIKIHLNVKLDVLRYHGKDRKSLVSRMEEADIVLTTYHTVVWESGKKANPIQDIEWFRVVLDEAHIIRRQQTTFNRCVSDLKSRSRWCLTGTPIQNKLDDIGALFSFIKVRPFENITTFRRYVTSPFNDSESDDRRPTAERNLTLLMDSMCLRRSRNLLHLPDPQNRIRIVEFSDEEREQYNKTMGIMNRALRQRVNEEHRTGVFGMFQIQLQLRILCNHGTYQHSFSWKRNLADEREDALCSIGNSGEVKCSVCRQCMPIMTKSLFQTYPACVHVLCFECLDDNEQIREAQGQETTGCPLCAKSGVPNNRCGPGASISSRGENYLRGTGISSKISALIEDIQVDLSKTKSIVFSCWTNTLDLIGKYLDAANITFERIDGDVSLGRRQKILDEFSSADLKIPVLIMTTGTGAFGLNLTSANRVFIIEPQWNPSVENQAISRAIRLKQKNSVVVTRYIVDKTVEQEIRSQQERKLEIADIGANATAQADIDMMYPGYGISSYS